MFDNLSNESYREKHKHILKTLETTGCNFYAHDLHNYIQITEIVIMITHNITYIRKSIIVDVIDCL